MLNALEIEDTVTEADCLERVQAWILTSFYELLCNKYQRSLISAGRMLRLLQVSRLYEIDALSSASNTDLLKNAVEAESARRTFWVAYISDRVTAFNDGLPLTLNEHEVST